jgi:glutathionylspermidine synthase
MSYDAYATRVLESGILSDPWVDGRPRLRQAPLVLTSGQQHALYTAAEAMAGVYDELCRLVGDEPALLDSFFALTPWQKAMWLASQPLWHGIARADLFMTSEGPVLAELNCDTPTGEAEAVVQSRLAALEHPGARDPNQELGARFCALVSALSARLGQSSAPRVAALVYPTEITEDLPLVRLYRDWLSARGYQVVLGSPYNLTQDAAGLRVFGRQVSLLVRHYKTDWWGERRSVWIDEDIADPEPLTEPLSALLDASIDGQVALVNPLGAVLPQNKRSMAFMWEHLHRFSPSAQASIQRYLPVSSRLEVLHPELLLAERSEWVLKSDYGAEGEEVVIGRLVDEAAFRTCLEKARPGRWIAQRYFSALENAERESVNYGVYLIAGQAAGLYARVQVGPTDGLALSVPTLIAD